MSRKETTVHLVRHGHVHNPDEVLYGRLPGYYLSEAGIKQAKKLAIHLSHHPIAAIYSSPLERTMQTAGILAEQFPGLEVIPDERLLEVATPLDGTPWEQLQSMQFNFYQPQYLEQGGESLQEISQRMEDFTREKVNQHAGQEILAISHGDPLMIMRAQYLHQTITVDALRGEYYVQTAHGVMLLFGELGITVEDIIPA